MKIPKVSVIVPVFNASSTLLICLESLRKQTVKIEEIIIVDNKSTDDSSQVVERYKKNNKNIKIIFLEKERTTSVASSFNMGLRKAKGEFILTMHSDSSLPTKNELGKLIDPLIQDTSCVAAYSYVLHPKEIWATYNFWEKCQSCRVVDQKIPAMNGKFDCYRKDVLIKLNGFDDINFDEHGDGLDADIHYRLKQIGKVAIAPASVVHLHYLKSDYALSMWINKRRNMSITAGRLLKMYLFKTDLKGILSFSLRPVLCLLPFLPIIYPIGLVCIVFFAFLYTPRMYVTQSTLRDKRILVLPFINVFLIYYESFWIVYTFFTHKVKTKKIL